LQVVCGKCSAGKVVLRELGYEAPERVCAGCASDPSRRYHQASEAPAFVPQYL
jgi:hypothetical protein